MTRGVRRKHHLDDLHRRLLAGGRDVTAHVARLRIAPDGLVAVAGHGIGRSRGRLEKRGQGGVQAGGELLQQHGRGLLSPRSIKEIIDRLTPLRSASASSDIARSARSWRTRVSRSGG